MRNLMLIKSFALIAICSLTAQSAQIEGDYVEARTADIFTGPCFSNAEVFIYGKQAVAAWKIRKGSFDGVDLTGLSVAAAIRGENTFSEDRPEMAQSVIITDENADSRQKEALIAFAKAMTGKRLQNVVAVHSAAIGLTVESHDMSVNMESHHKHHGMPQAPRASVWVPGIAEILTRPLDDTDHLCGNEVVAYAPLSKAVDVLPAYTLGHRFSAAGLGGTWNDPNARSSFVGHFAY